MTAYRSLDKLLNPRSIAIVGASVRPESYGCMVLDMLVHHGFPGAIYPINPRYPELRGLTCYPDLASVPGPVDLAYIAVPSSAVISLLGEAGELGVGGAVVPGSGFADGGPEGVKLQAELVATADRYGIAMCGPNNMGYINYHDRTASWPTQIPDIESPGKIALVTQSGSVGIAISQDGRGLNLGFLVGSGNEANVGAADYLDYFVHDDRVEVVLMFLEAIRDPVRFAKAAREARACGKRVGVVKVGRSETASRMVSAHTGAIAGEDKVYDAFFRQHGILRVHDLDELVELGALLTSAPTPPGCTAMAAITLSGGEGALAADLASEMGLELPELDPETLARLQREFPPFSKPRNPVDAYGLGWDSARFGRIVEALVEDPRIGIIPLCMDSASSEKGDDGMVAAMAQTCARFVRGDKQFVYINNTSGSGMSNSARVAMDHAGVPALLGLREGLSAVAAWTRLKTPLPVLAPDPENADLPTHIATSHTERERINLLDGAGVPMVKSIAVASADQAVEAAETLGPPVVMKGTAVGLLHKTEHSLVELGIADATAVRAAFEALTVRLRKAAPDPGLTEILMQPMVTDGVELILGAHHSDGFGTVIAVGPGGTLVEIIKRASVRLAPVDFVCACEMLDETPAGLLLRGTRGRGPYDLDAACEAIVAFSRLAAASRGVATAIEVNPLMVRPRGQGVVGLDAVVEA